MEQHAYELKNIYLGWVFWLLVSVVFLLGVLLIVVTAPPRFLNDRVSEKAVEEISTIKGLEGLSPDALAKVKKTVRFWVSEVSREPLYKGIGRDLGLALMIAVILTITLEFFARKRLDAEVRSGVLDATFMQIIPPPIFAEVKDFVIRQPVLQKDWELTMHVVSLDWLEKNCFLSETTIRYKLASLVRHKQIYVVHSHLDTHITGNDQQDNRLPKYLRVKIGNYEQTNFQEYLVREGFALEVPYTLPPFPDITEVVIEVRELIRVPETFTRVVNGITENAKLHIESSVAGIAFAVRPLHPDLERIEEPVPGKTWILPRGLLPYQGFEIVCTEQV